MRLIRLSNLTEFAWDKLGYSAGDTERSLMESVTQDYLLAVPSGSDTPMAVIGLMSGSLLSQHVVLWFGLFEGAEPSVRDIRESRVVIEKFFAQHPDKYFQAETKLGDRVSEKFARFYGFTPVMETADRTLYEREN